MYSENSGCEVISMRKIDIFWRYNEEINVIHPQTHFLSALDRKPAGSLDCHLSTVCLHTHFHRVFSLHEKSNTNILTSIVACRNFEGVHRQASFAVSAIFSSASANKL